MTENRYKSVKRKIKILYMLAIWAGLVAALGQLISRY